MPVLTGSRLSTDWTNEVEQSLNVRVSNTCNSLTMLHSPLVVEFVTGETPSGSEHGCLSVQNKTQPMSFQTKMGPTVFSKVLDGRHKRSKSYEL